MLFNSLRFWLFFLLVFLFYLPLQRKQQNWLLILASYFFYFCVARGFVILLCFTTLFDFWCGKRIAGSRSSGERKLLLFLSVLSNLSILLFFKYAGFFSPVLTALTGGEWAASLFTLVAPIGISFYILQSMSYVIDIFRGEIEPHSQLEEYALYISFFPQLLAGPIERAGQMLPQISSPRKVTCEGLRRGAWLCFWGLVEKCVVSDNLQSRVITPYFQENNSNGLASAVVLWACCLRVYCDFDGYSNIARGLARMMGFELSLNFFLPLYALSSKGFWRRFHITFYRWLKDYIFSPLVKHLLVPVPIALVLVFVISGLWHEFRWTFVCWGLFEAFSILISEFPGRWLAPRYESTRGISRVLFAFAGIIGMRFFRMISTAFFLAASVPQAWSRLSTFFQFSGWHIDAIFLNVLLLHLFFVFPIFLVEFPQLLRRGALAHIETNPWLRGFTIYVLGIYLLVFGATNAQKFVYFQF